MWPVSTFGNRGFPRGHPERIKEFNGNARKIARRSAMNFAAVPPKPPIGASSVIGLSRNPNNFIAVVAATKFSLLPHHAATRSRLRRFYCFALQEIWLFRPKSRHNGL
jgi:hypothetical protein